MDGLRIGNYALDTELMMEWGEKIGVALIILLLTWIVAKAAKWAFAKLVDNISLLQRDTGSGESIGMSLGKIVSLLIWLFGLIAVLSTFGLNSVIEPLQTLLDDVMGFIPNIIGAGIIFFVGSIVANIVKQIVETTMMTVNLDKWANKAGAEEVTGNSTISKTIGTIVYVLIIIPIAILALDALNMSTITEPATSLLNTIFTSIPLVIGAAILLGIAYMIARWVGGLIEEVLPGLGVDRSVNALGILPEKTTVSSVVSKIVIIAIMLFAAIAATRMLQFPELTNILNEVLALGGKVIFGGVIIGLGFMIANILARIVGGASEGSMGSQIVKYATIVLFVAMGLKYMGLADSIINMAFGALVIGGGVAAALAFGLGGRDAAAKTLEDMRSAKPKAPAARKPAARKPAADK
ncbi:mechanosensitive ion channel [Sphingorhabdus sp. EL138]|uniref:mechanosensitive ion channel n=1 Tax=Sphingorhabdus sp. EL138 TaxID=2073156 RepID=UPI0020B13703|nr:mechanosensitive ion channel [Sphingorhabdus sp. EL138]